jgi:hypothetical protein
MIKIRLVSQDTDDDSVTDHGEMSMAEFLGERGGWLVWRPGCGKPEFLALCPSEESARELVGSLVEPGWSITPIPATGRA